MIALEDIEDLTCLTRDEIEALAEHDHTDILTAALDGEYAMHRHGGPAQVRDKISEDVQRALKAGDTDHARALMATLRHFLYFHPEAV